MAILQTCCFWSSLRKGSIASVIYSIVYFGSSVLFVSSFLHDERQYLAGEIEKPIGDSFLERDSISPITVIFNILLLFCALCGIVSSILVLIGLKLDKREFLLPWIMTMIANILVECSHFIYLIIIETLYFEPLTAILYTIDFFIMCLNVYCLLCVISQYQEYKAGRGGRMDLPDSNNSTHYVPPTSTNVCVNSFRLNHLASPIICPHTNCTIIPEDTTQIGNGNSCKKYKNSFHQRHSKLLKKQVKFPDDIKCCPNNTNIICENYSEMEKSFIEKSSAFW